VPLIVIGLFVVINLCGVHGELFKGIAVLSIIASAMPIGMNVVVYPESAGLDSTEGAKTCFISYVLAVALMPVIFMLMETVVNSFV
jgi:predicted permease